jgi:Transcriptional regulator PadR-like family
VLQVETGSLYPALHRLERQKWVESEWRMTESKQKAKYYRITAAGKEQLAENRSKWWRKRNELDAEIDAHICLAVEERVARGEDEASARRVVEREVGNIPLVKDVAREAWRWVWLERLLQDVRFAVRLLRKSPACAVTVIATLALGIAAPVAMFTVMDRVMLRPLPYRDAGRLVYINVASRRNEHDWRSAAPYLDLAEWRKWSRSFEGIGYFTEANGRNFLEGKTATEGVGFYKVSPNLFDVLGAAPALGRDEQFVSAAAGAGKAFARCAVCGADDGSSAGEDFHNPFWAEA